MRIRIGKLVREAWQIVGIAVLLLCVLEGGFLLGFFIKDLLSASDGSNPDRRAMADTYSDPTWVNQYYEEHRHSSVARWKPYVYWRREPYQGNYINIDTNGVRLTTWTKAMQQDSRTPLKIFMFGGSTLWGTGARDAFTIPSIFATQLQNRGVATEVVNFGESGYVSTQEVIALLLQLQKGQIPDLVIFYDGANDVYSAYQQRVAGLPQNEFHRMKEFNLSQPAEYKQRISMALQDVAGRFSTIRFVKETLREADLWRDPADAALPLPLDTLAPEREALAEGVIATYRGNIEIVKALAEHYHFKYIFYWQPTIFQKKQLTQYELAGRAKEQPLDQFVRRTYEAMQQGRLFETHGYSFQDLSLVFADTREPVYVDWCHLGESGNEIIAKRMATDALALIDGDQRARLKPSRHDREPADPALLRGINSRD